jgi:hypothetical protein
MNLAFRVLSALSILMVLACSLLAAGCGSGCENSVLLERQSPDRTKRAVVYFRKCGTFDERQPATMVSILKADADLPDEDGNVFIADWNEGKVVTRPGGPTAAIDVQVEWSSPTLLVISYPDRSRILKGEVQLEGVTIHLEKK